MSPAPASAPILCDSCGRAASPGHIRERLARLELATRYRPIHISLLLMSAAPPGSPSDDLYAWEQQSAGPGARNFVEGLLQTFAISLQILPAEQLAELQRQGIFLARLVECPLSPELQLNALAPEFGPVLVKRIAYSYKPRRIALLEPVAPGLPEVLRTAGFGDRLISQGQGIEFPAPHDSAAILRLRSIVIANPKE